jgi:hypothetical protein
MRILRQLTFALILVALAAPGWAQAVVSLADISRLETTAGDIERLIASVERTDPTLAAEAKKTLVDLRDDITYLRVKLRRDGAVSRDDYADVRDRLDGLSRKVRGEQRVYAQTPGAETTSRFFTVPVGTEMDVRLQTPLNSGTARVEQRFEATTMVDLAQGKDVVIPAGSVVRGFVSSVRPAGKIDRTGSLTLSFDELVVNQRASKLRASVTKALDPKLSDDVSRIGAGAAIGAVIGGILAGGKGALLGVLIGGGGTIASTEGSDVDLPIGTILRIRIDQPVEIGGSSQTADRYDP